MEIRRYTPYQFGLFYFIFFAWMGLQIPYFNLYLYHAGMNPFQIGIITAAFPLVRVFAPGLWGYIADRFDRRGWTSPILWLLSTLTFSFLFFVEGFIPILATIILFTFFWAPTLPLVEAATMMVVSRTGIDYGRMRVWGTTGFIAFSIGAGFLLDLWPTRLILWGMITLLLFNTILSLSLPSRRAGEAGIKLETLFKHLRQREVFLFLTVAMLMLFSHSAYYGFLSIYLESLGYSKGLIGFLWALGPLGEILIMLYSGPILRRFGTNKVICFSLLMAILRWSIFASTDHLLLLIAAQLLHAFTFGTFHIASIRHIEDLFPEEMKNTGQAMYNSATYGTGLVLGSIVSGLLYESAGASVLFIISALAAFLAFVLMRYGKRQGSFDTESFLM